MIFRLWLSLLAFMLVTSVAARAQVQSTGTQSQPAAPNAPLELPDVFVTGKVVVDIAAGAKQAPQKPFRLTALDLDSLNPSEKFPSPAVPNRQLPAFARLRNTRSYYIDASFGSYVSPEVEAGAAFRAGNYQIDADFDCRYSRDWAPGAELLDAGLAVSSSYLAPEKFYLFGKGLTETDVSVRHRAYTLFADPRAPMRNTTRLHASLSTEAFVDDQPIKALFDWHRHAVSTTSVAEMTDQRLRASISGNVSARYGFEALVDLQSKNDVGYPFYQMSALRSFGDTLLNVRAKFGLQYGQTTTAMQRTGVLVDVEATYQASEVFSFGAALRSGLHPVSYSALISQNPFISTQSQVDLPYDIANAEFRVKYHPTQAFIGLARVGIKQTTRSLLWQGDSLSQFSIFYADASTVSAALDLSYSVSRNDMLLGTVNIQQVTLQSGGKATYVEPLRLDAIYERKWNADMRTRLLVQYVGKRWADILGLVQIDSYTNIGANLAYGLGRDIEIVASVDNLINSTIILWNGYRERGIFVSGGVSWRL